MVRYRRCLIRLYRVLLAGFLGPVVSKFRVRVEG